MTSHPPEPMPIEKCPNPECRKPDCIPMPITEDSWAVQCCDCHYWGPAGDSDAEAIRLHNAICVAPDDGKGQPIGEFIEAFKAYYPDLSQLINAFKAAEDYAWSDWDESVRVKWLRLGDMAWLAATQVTTAAPQGWQRETAREICEAIAKTFTGPSDRDIFERCISQVEDLIKRGAK